ncbi:aminotransferase class I/II-fold pyridoxal phosphate-dependent enzyme [Desulfovibrio mangrovi]|uniref:aminotransferase class I/II-fold pyridoxal phosphate-dependent enzyme n=1 Tax=Desulfovibrio mangrovi TaxID=2976983 RepID=UPI0022453A51|nr:aminotransferase class I/II-fold pyridoxal phosphate-dependent enzyme [Desulfovibrio mangrovi]UZP66728.1 aminotransferase class I/II-fold pyridoxal phosphate-dependent enzyme [Desulfovibrio mangrovi]
MTGNRSSLANRLALRLESMRTAGLHRNPPRIDARHGAHLVTDGRRCVNFGSNDYLGLGTCPEWQRTVQSCFAAHAPSASSSRLVTGHLAETEQLESAFAARFGYEECLFFPSGYQANLAVITGLLADADAICFDRRIHASMAHALAALGAREDGPALSGYAHGDISRLEQKLRRHLDRPGAHLGEPAIAILTESLFSMDGDTLCMPALHAAAKAHKAFTIVDEAHAMGALGPCGLGLASHAVQKDTSRRQGADIVVGTLGKALGLFGAFVLMPAGFKEYLSNIAAPVIYSTAMPPAFAACALAALDRVAGMDAERASLARLGLLFRDQLADGPFPLRGDAHILALEVGDENRATRMAAALREQGLLVFAARHPTVPAGRAILRISLTAAHGDDDITRLAQALRITAREIALS